MVGKNSEGSIYRSHHFQLSSFHLYHVITQADCCDIITHDLMDRFMCNKQ